MAQKKKKRNGSTALTVETRLLKAGRVPPECKVETPGAAEGLCIRNRNGHAG